MARILIIEDNELNRELVVRRLVKRGMEVIEAVDGEHGLESAQRELPDLIVLDLGLPGVDGWEVARRLKAAPATQAIPILALTAHARLEDLERARVAGCDEIETKPVVLERFLEKLHRLLEFRTLGSHASSAGRS